MKLRLTPLNITVAIAFIYLALLLFEPRNSELEAKGVDLMVKLLLAALILVSFIADLIFRFTIKDLKRIWFIEMAFIAIAVLFFLILQK